jgi:stage II sporulation protein D
MRQALAAFVLLLALAAAAAPPVDAGAASAAASLTVRVLETARPLEVELEVTNGSLRCDAQLLESGKVSLRADGKAIAAGARRCERVTTDGDGVTVKLKELTRRYRGALWVGTDDFHLALYNVVGVEPYLRGVVGAQTEPQAEEALRAQAVVSRTFALASRGRHDAADLCDLPHCLVYRGREAERPDADAAVAKTTGEVLLVGGVVLRPAHFHPACGGVTSSAAEVFGDESLPGGGASDAVAWPRRAGEQNSACRSDAGAGPLCAGAKEFRPDRGPPRGPPDVASEPLCAGAADFAWTWRVDRPALAAALGLKAEGAALEVLRRDGAGRVLEARVFGRRLSGAELWALIERSPAAAPLRSLKFTVVEAESVAQFDGAGAGHGVGLCQAGARAAAERGWDYRRILGLYFPTRSVRPLR